MLITLLSAWYKCAQQLGNVELSVKLLVEMLAEKSSSYTVLSTIFIFSYHIDDQGNQDEEYQAPEDLLAILKVSTIMFNLLGMDFYHLFRVRFHRQLMPPSWLTL